MYQPTLEELEARGRFFESNKARLHAERGPKLKVEYPGEGHSFVTVTFEYEDIVLLHDAMGVWLRAASEGDLPGDLQKQAEQILAEHYPHGQCPTCGRPLKESGLCSEGGHE